MRTAVLRGLFNSSVYLKTAPFAVAKLSTWEAVRSFTTGPSNPWEPNRRPTPTKHYRNPPFVDRKTGGPSSGDNKTPNPTPPPPSADSSFAVTHEDLSLSGRYATALFRVIRSSSKDLKTLDHVWKDLETLKCCLNEECSRLKIIIETPGVDAARKAEVLQSLLPLGFSDLTVRFLLLLLENKRLNLLPKIIDAFENFYREAKGEVRCHVTSAEVHNYCNHTLEFTSSHYRCDRMHC